MRRLALVGLCVSSLAAACGFPGVTFIDASSDGATDGEALSDATSGEGSAGVDGTTGPDSPGSEDAGGDVGAEGGADGATDASSSDAADARAPQDSGQDVGASDAAEDTGPRKDAAADGPNCNCGAGSMLPTNLSCSSLLGLGCKGSGFTGSGPVCGTAGPYYTCVAGIGTCTAENPVTTVQECQ